MERRYVNKTEARVGLTEGEDGEPRAISGYGAVFYRGGDDPGTEYELFDGVFERIMPGAFDRALQEQDDTRGLFNHDADNLLGRTANGTMRLSVDDIGLRYEIDIDHEDPDHKRVLAKIKRGDLSGSSFAFQVERAVWVEEEAREIRQVESVRLYDTGPVTYPAYTGTSTSLRSESDGSDVRAELAAWRQKQKLSNSTRIILDKPIPRV